MRTASSLAIFATIASLAWGCSGTESETVSTLELELSTTQLQKLVAPDAAANDHFGSSVAISNGFSAVIGSPRDDVGANVDQGSAYVLVSNGNTWSVTQRLSGGGSLGLFGSAVAMTGGILHETVAATAPSSNFQPNGSRGAVYVFRNAGLSFVQEAVLVPSGAANNELFGGSVALEGDTLLVGGGATYVFVRTGTTWTQQQRIAVRSGSVALSGETALLGDAGATVGSNAGQGLARVFVRSGAIWTEQQILTAADGQPGDFFGSSVAVSGDVALIGDADDQISGTRRGSAYFFRRSGTVWSQEQKVLPSDGAPDDRFGIAVAVAGDLAVIGANGHEHLGQNANHGSAYLFLRNAGTWVEDREIRSADGQNNDFFGASAALVGNTVLIGADNDDGPLGAQGSAYAFVFSGVNGEPCAANNGCLSGFCSDGRCCDTSCDGPCNACSVAAGATRDGLCTILPASAQGSPSCAPLTCSGTSPRCADPESCEADFVELSAGLSHTCGLRSNGEVDCWGLAGTFWGNTPPVGQKFAAISAGIEHTIGLYLDGTLAFWGNDQNGLGTLPAGPFRAIVAGYGHDCAIRIDGTLACWGWNGSGQTNAPSGTFRSVAVGTTHTCALRSDSTITCFGSNDFGESNAPAGLFRQVSARGQQGCGQRFDGTIQCWGRSTDLQDWAPPPPDSFLSLECRGVAACAMRADHTITCWGNGSPVSQAPGGQFLSFAMGDHHGCGIRPDRSVACWGLNSFGQANPP